MRHISANYATYKSKRRSIELDEYRNCPENREVTIEEEGERTERWAFPPICFDFCA